MKPSGAWRCESLAAARRPFARPIGAWTTALSVWVRRMVRRGCPRRSAERRGRGCYGRSNPHRLGLVADDPLGVAANELQLRVGTRRARSRTAGRAPGRPSGRSRADAAPARCQRSSRRPDGAASAAAERGATLRVGVPEAGPGSGADGPSTGLVARGSPRPARAPARPGAGRSAKACRPARGLAGSTARRAARHPGEEGVERPSPGHRPGGEPPGLARTPGDAARRRSRGTDAPTASSGRGRLSGAGQLAGPPARLGEVQEALVVEASDPERLELGPGQGKRARSAGGGGRG